MENRKDELAMKKHFRTTPSRHILNYQIAGKRIISFYLYSNKFYRLLKSERLASIILNPLFFFDKEIDMNQALEHYLNSGCYGPLVKQ